MAHRIEALYKLTYDGFNHIFVSATSLIDLFSFIANEVLDGHIIGNVSEYKPDGTTPRIRFKNDASYKRILYNLKHEREAEHTEVLGVPCKVWKIKNGKGKNTYAYRFTVPGWNECTTTGLRDTKRVISARLDPAVRNTLGLDKPKIYRLNIVRNGYAVVEATTDEEAIKQGKKLTENDFDWEDVDQSVLDDIAIVEEYTPVD